MTKKEAIEMIEQAPSGAEFSVRIVCINKDKERLPLPYRGWDRDMGKKHRISAQAARNYRWGVVPNSTHGYLITCREIREEVRKFFEDRKVYIETLHKLYR